MHNPLFHISTGGERPNKQKIKLTVQKMNTWTRWTKLLSHAHYSLDSGHSTKSTENLFSYKSYVELLYMDWIIFYARKRIKNISSASSVFYVLFIGSNSWASRYKFFESFFLIHNKITMSFQIFFQQSNTKAPFLAGIMHNSHCSRVTRRVRFSVRREHHHGTWKLIPTYSCSLSFSILSKIVYSYSHRFVFTTIYLYYMYEYTCYMYECCRDGRFRQIQ